MAQTRVGPPAATQRPPTQKKKKQVSGFKPGESWLENSSGAARTEAAVTSAGQKGSLGSLNLRFFWGADAGGASWLSGIWY